MNQTDQLLCNHSLQAVSTGGGCSQYGCCQCCLYGGGQGSWQKAGHSANGKAQFKWRSYKGALARQKTGGPGWLAKSTTKETDVFVPFAFEVGGCHFFTLLLIMRRFRVDRSTYNPCDCLMVVGRIETGTRGAFTAFYTTGLKVTNVRQNVRSG